MLEGIDFPRLIDCQRTARLFNTILVARRALVIVVLPTRGFPGKQRQRRKRGTGAARWTGGTFDLDTRRVA